MQMKYEYSYIPPFWGWRCSCDCSYFLPYLSLNVLVIKVFSQRNECKLFICYTTVYLPATTICRVSKRSLKLAWSVSCILWKRSSSSSSCLIEEKHWTRKGYNLVTWDYKLIKSSLEVINWYHMRVLTLFNGPLLLFAPSHHFRIYP